MRPFATSIGLPIALTLAGILVWPVAGALAQAGGGAPPPPAVTVETVKTRTLPVTYEYAGRVAASREVQIRARVGGILLQRDFEEGSRVAEGDLLFRIDPATYEAEVALARAQVVEAQAQLAQARRSEERARALAQRGASSQANLDDAISARELGEARVEAANAQLRSASLQLDYATVEAPVGGITSLEQVPEGSLLQTGDLLTRIDQLDPINVNFSAADTEAQSIRELIENGTLKGASAPGDLKVSIRFGDGSTYERTGTIDFTSTTIDSQTGTILSRAVLPNPDQRLLPGQFVRLVVEGLSVENAITLPTEALMQGPQGTFVYTLNAENAAEVRPITVARDLDGSILVSQGLEEGDRVITKGVVKVRPGSPVDPQAAEEPAEPEGGEPAGNGADGTAQAGEASGAAGEPAEKATNGGETAEPEAAPEKAASRSGPPVPRSALPDGEAVRLAQGNPLNPKAEGRDRAELIE
ncbi:efflux RND transporter periplasmic adaptor subunit [Fulvimarina endophytica]|uniref:Efflux RND transporter periplasmic adaptor subunit n=1 Tax=Fulvimarina endophytica TaxID=2293836 RepID=A0A371X5Q4_9HYPH|nr:efflux RND transporter periplasmic adaptor subunit [Fulvimarina endophytica]RFC64364.1 efflux RND transporter periplasmic adaptor subunit [Fulvimarina endophytica]